MDLIGFESLGRTVEVVSTKISTAKKNQDKEHTINELTELINDLLKDKTELLSAVRLLEQEVVSQTIEERDFDFITDKVIPELINVLTDRGIIAEEQLGEIQKYEKVFKTLFSKEVLKTLQILGFNYKKAIGEPLTSLISNLINSKKNSDANSQNLIIQYNNKIAEIMLDPDSYERAKLNGLVK